MNSSATSQTNVGRPAFTLIELIGIVVLLGAFTLVLIPALGRTRPNNKAIQCLNNLRQFTAGWTMYTADNGDRVANNFASVASIQSGALDSWANNVMTWTAGTSIYDISNTNLDWVVNGVLGKYFTDPALVYKCPADIYLSPVQVSAGYRARVRSISMNSLFGLYNTGNNTTSPWLNQLFSQYRQYLNQTCVLKPAKTWLVLDEHPDSINDGLFVNNPTANSWEDIPASYHNGACGFAFVDGHSELKEWQSRRSSIVPVHLVYSTPPIFDSLGRLDYAWYLERCGYVNASTGLPAFNY